MNSSSNPVILQLLVYVLMYDQRVFCVVFLYVFVMLSTWSHGLQLRTANKMAPNQGLEMGLTKIHNKI